MNYDKNYLLQYLFFLVCLLVFIPSCEEEPPPNSTNEITKVQRAQLGQTISDVLSDEKQYDLVSREEAENVIALEWLERLYKQAYFTMRDDADDSLADQWDKTRDWSVNIIISDDVMAFCIPGGDFYITTRFLRELNFESELFYIMAFEAHLMDQRFLLNKLVTLANSPNNLVEIGKNGQGDGITALDLLVELYNSINYSDPPNTVMQLDQLTVNTICNNSAYRRAGVTDLDISNSNWCITRPSYIDREMMLEDDLLLGESDECLGNKFFVSDSNFFPDLVDSLIY